MGNEIMLAAERLMLALHESNEEAAGRAAISLLTTFLLDVRRIADELSELSRLQSIRAKCSVALATDRGLEV